jgi:hypothetical protein
MRTTYENQTTELINPAPIETNEVTCNDGTKDITNGKKPPCINNGGVKPLQEIVTVKTGTPAKQESDLQYYTSANFLKRASVSIVPVTLIGVYCYNKKFSLTKSALLVSIPIVIITGLQYVFMGGGKNAYWGIFIPPSIRANQMKKILLEPQKINK